MINKLKIGLDNIKWLNLDRYLQGCKYSLSRALVLPKGRVALSALLMLGAVQIAQAAESKWNPGNYSFNQATKILNQIVYEWHRKEFYCNMDFDVDDNITNMNWFDSTKAKNLKRSIQWDHIVPASHFWQAFSEWRDWHALCVTHHKNWTTSNYDWRRCAEKASPEYRKMQNDMYNLVPANWAINNIRKNKQFWEIPWEIREYWICDIEISEDYDLIEPSEELRWFVARVYMYMQETYPKYKILSDQNIKLYTAWNKMYPPTEWEVIRAKRIEQIQWNRNYVIERETQRTGKKGKSGDKWDFFKDALDILSIIKLLD